MRCASVRPEEVDADEPGGKAEAVATGERREEAAVAGRLDWVRRGRW